MIIVNKRLVVAWTLVAAGCGLRVPHEGTRNTGALADLLPLLEPQQGPGDLKPRAAPLQSCAELEEHLETRMIADMERTFTNQMRWLARSSKGAAEAVPLAADAAASPPEPVNYSKTNNQVAGLEEPDVVKSNGTHAFQLAGGKLHVLQLWPAEELKEIASAALEGEPSQLFLMEAEKRVVVLSRPRAPASASDKATFLPRPAPELAATLVEVIDVANPAAPRAIGRYELAGAVLSGRRVGPTLRLVLQSSLPTPQGVRYYPEDQDFWQKPVEVQLAWYEAQLNENRRIIKEQALAFWLDAGRFSPPADLGDCSRVHAPNVSTPAGLTRVVTLDLNGTHVDQTILLAAVAQVYASPETLYLATPFYWWNEESRNIDHTFLHAFDLRDSAKAPYIGSGRVDGTLVNQFAMDEHAGYLRLATTVWTKETTLNRVSVFAVEPGELRLVGATPDLAPGERVQSARFVGERGYVVTFRRVDPLFTLDLKEPTAPKVVGELKIPGFSTYIHPIDDGRLLTVGYDADPLTGRALGMKVSLFDVTDPAAPREAGTYVLSGQSWSDAQWDHKAFTWYAPKGVLALPVTMYAPTPRPGGYSAHAAASLLLFDVHGDSVTPRGSLGLADFGKAEEHVWGSWVTPARLRRALFVEDGVYAVADEGVRSARLDALEKPLATVKY